MKINYYCPFPFIKLLAVTKKIILRNFCFFMFCNVLIASINFIRQYLIYSQYHYLTFCEKYNGKKIRRQTFIKCTYRGTAVSVNFLHNISSTTIRYTIVDKTIVLLDRNLTSKEPEGNIR